ncbi:MAG: alanine--tRNA ligase [Nanoarchaeota archaeon]
MNNIKNREQLINLYIEFFKTHGHKEVPNSSLVPINDPTVLFTPAGMHPLIPYLLGQVHPLGKKLVNVQRCIRTGDIEEVGNDGFHLTFFEMLGQWSLNDYWKKEALEMAFEFLTKNLEIPIEKLSVTCFKGDKDAPKDDESAKIWLSLGIPKNKMFFLGKEDNFWGPVSETGPCGPDTEVFYYTGKGNPKGNPSKSKEWSEIWNAGVFMQYNKTKSGKYEFLKHRNVDTGMGVERTLAILQGKKSVFETHVFTPIVNDIENLSGKKYGKNKLETKSFRIVADHLKAAVFITADGIKPSNIERGYVLRRLIRRAIRHARLIGISDKFTSRIALTVIRIYQDYKDLQDNKKIILEELDKEETKFLNTLDSGIKEFSKMIKSKKELSGKDAFLLFQSHGFPIEITEELAKENKVKLDRKGFDIEFKKHQELSRTSSAGVFKSGLADNSLMTTRLHTATHLLNEALRQIISKDIRQKGSNINPERLRFDFNFSRKLTNEEVIKIEEWINDKINKSLEVIREEMPLEKALKSGAQSEFNAKYPEIVSVYTILGKNKEIVSREICTGPHVKNTSEIGHFKITKEEGIAAGIRRIKAIVS